jgi:hypothetical protein
MDAERGLENNNDGDNEKNDDDDDDDDDANFEFDKWPVDGDDEEAERG